MSYMERFLVVEVKSLHRFLESTAHKVSFFGMEKESSRVFWMSHNAFFGESIA